MLLAAVVNDVRFAARTLLRSRGYTLIGCLTLALGIGASIAMFTVMRSVLWRPLPYPDADRLVVIETDARGVRNAGAFTGELLDIRQRSRSLEQVSMGNGVDAHVEVDGVVERASAASVSEDFLPALGIQPALGRAFDGARDVREGAAVSVLISDELWRRRFGADPAALGQRVLVNNRPREVIGVLPPDVRMFMPGSIGMEERVDVWFATTIDSDRGGGRGAVAIARLTPGRTRADAQRELDALAAQFMAEHADVYRSDAVIFRVREAREALVDQVDRGLQALGAAVAFVMLIACINVANLTLVRQTGRTRELAVRRALGAGRGRLVQQLVTESLLLAILAGVFGVLLGAWGVQLLEWLRPTHLPRQSQVRTDLIVTLFSVGVSLAAGVLLGLLPALRGSSDALAGLRTGRADSPARSARRLQRGLVIAEVALSIVPLIAAGLMLRSFVNLTRAPVGFNPDRVLTAWMPVSFREFPELEDRWRVHLQALEQIRQLPGVEAVSAGSPLPFHSLSFTRRYGRAEDGDPRALALQQTVMPGYFDVVGTRLLQGRDVTADDFTARRRVIIVDRRIADALWPDGRAIGQRLAVALERADVREVIGVTEPVRASAVRDESLPTMFVPYHVFAAEPMGVLIRTEASAATLGPLVNRTVQALGTGREVHSFRPLSDYVRDSIADTRFMMLVLALFAGTAVLLAAIGLYGTLAYLTSQRAREFGIRLALGATGREIVGLVAREGLALTAIGGVVGLAGGLAASRVLQRLMYGVHVADPVTLIGVTLLFSLVALLACVRPASTAGRTDPAQILRFD